MDIRYPQVHATAMICQLLEGLACSRVFVFGANSVPLDLFISWLYLQILPLPQNFGSLHLMKNTTMPYISFNLIIAGLKSTVSTGWTLSKHPGYVSSPLEGKHTFNQTADSWGRQFDCSLPERQRGRKRQRNKNKMARWNEQMSVFIPVVYVH